MFFRLKRVDQGDKVNKTLTKTLRGFVAGTLALVCASVIAADFPKEVVKLVVPSGAGGTNDLVARLLAPKLAEKLGSPFVVENKPGAGGIIGTDSVAKAKADGHTLLVTSSVHTVAPSVFKSLPYDAIKDFTPITTLVSVPMVLVGSPQLPVSSMNELLSLAKSQPGKLQFGSAGNGTLNHLLGELLRSTADINIVHVPYKSIGAAVQDVMGGHIPLAFASLPSVAANIRAGQLKGLGLAKARDGTAVQGIPPIADSVPGYDADLWVGIFAPSGTPDSIVAQLHAAVTEVLKSVEVSTKLAEMGAIPLTSSSENFSNALKEDLMRWSKVVTATGAKVD